MRSFALLSAGCSCTAVHMTDCTHHSPRYYVSEPYALAGCGSSYRPLKCLLRYLRCCPLPMKLQSIKKLKAGKQPSSQAKLKAGKQLSSQADKRPSSQAAKNKSSKDSASEARPHHHSSVGKKEGASSSTDSAKGAEYEDGGSNADSEDDSTDEREAIEEGLEIERLTQRIRSETPETGRHLQLP